MLKARLIDINQEHKEALAIPDSPSPWASGAVQVPGATIMPTQVTRTPTTTRMQLTFSPVTPIEIADDDDDR